MPWLLALALAIVALSTLLPFNFTWSAQSHEILKVTAGEARRLLYSTSPGAVVDACSNILLYIPPGIAFAMTLRSRSPGLLRTRALAGACGFALSLSIEVLQQWLPSRAPSLIDVACNTGGALIGAIGYSGWGTAFTARVHRFRGEASPAGRVAVLTACSAIALLASGVIQFCSRPSNWNDDFLLSFGNEATGNRRWRGRVLSFDVSDTALSPEALCAFAAGDSGTAPNGTVLSLDWTVVREWQAAAARPPQFEWVGAASAPATQGLDVGGHGWLRSAVPVRDIAQRIRAANQFTMRLVCASGRSPQFGPARIVSYSAGPLRGNFTIGQEGTDLIFRLRTPNTGANGARIPLRIPAVFADDGVRDILFSYSGWVLRAAVAGSNNVQTLELSPGTVVASFYSDPEYGHGVWLNTGYYLLLAALHVVLIASISRTRSGSLLLGVPWIFAFAWLLESTLAIAAPRALDWSNVAMSIGLGAAVLSAAVALSGRGPTWWEALAGTSSHTSQKLNEPDRAI